MTLPKKTKIKTFLPLSMLPLLSSSHMSKMILSLSSVRPLLKRTMVSRNSWKEILPSPSLSTMLNILVTKTSPEKSVNHNLLKVYRWQGRNVLHITNPSSSRCLSMLLHLHPKTWGFAYFNPKKYIPKKK